ncbi:MAG: hypothetical protein BWY65_02146 [Firmicutes bacterium ADurb.Bin373]|nr:MAG: hypothetical protein BWY65_02146 [Firmicutes bacterium ADurb.Bin373]
MAESTPVVYTPVTMIFKNKNVLGMATFFLGAILKDFLPGWSIWPPVLINRRGEIIILPSMRGTEPVSSNEKIARLKILTKTGIKAAAMTVPTVAARMTNRMFWLSETSSAW